MFIKRNTVHNKRVSGKLRGGFGLNRTGSVLWFVRAESF